MRQTPSSGWRPALYAVPIAVAVVAFLAFLPVLQNDFVTWDDDRNFLDNPNYRGLGLTQLRWMWTTFHMGHYVPLSWMTLGLDFELWGMDARGYHLTNLLLHTANAVLTYFVAKRVLRLAMFDRESSARSLEVAAGFAALLFAVHPLRVESVAWATERRDVLSGLFCLACVLCYLRAVEPAARFRRWYTAAVLLFVAALLSKATSVTMPAILAILNVYPLKRWTAADWRGVAARRVYAEIAPFAALAVAVIPLTLVALAPPDQLTLGAKIAVSAYSLAFYVWKSLVPTGLSPLYAMPTSIDPGAGQYVASYAIVIGITVGAWLARRRHPGVTAAWAMFLAVISPMLGIVQNGPQIAADRYTYHPSPALTILAAAAGLVLVRRSPSLIRGALPAAGLLLFIFSVLTWRQARIWHDPERFWSYVVSTDSSSSVGHTALGTLALKQNRIDDAIAEYRLALRTDPRYAEGHDNLGVALSRQGKFAEATEHYRLALALSPRNHESHNNLGVASANLGRFAEAIAEYEEAIELKPDYADAQTNWGNVLVRMGKPEDAIAHYRESLRLRPGNPDAQFNWGVALALEGRLEEAADRFRAVLAGQPDHAEARDYLAKAVQLQRQREIKK